MILNKFKKSDSELLSLYQLINVTENIRNTPIQCFFESDDLEVKIIEEDSIAIFLPMPQWYYDELVNGERCSFVLPPDCHFEHEDNIFIISMNENTYPTGDWELCQLRVIEISRPEHLVPGILPGYTLVELDQLTTNDYKSVQ